MDKAQVVVEFDVLSIHRLAVVCMGTARLTNGCAMILPLEGTICQGRKCKQHKDILKHDRVAALWGTLLLITC
jgi:hypothetical protein